MKNLRFIIVQPASNYYTWQVEVQIQNLLRLGVNPNNIDYVCGVRAGEATPEVWRKLADTYNTVRFFFYHDTREKACYVSSIRPHLLEKHFKNCPELKDEAIFYIDSDVIFTRPPVPELSPFVDDDVWYLSDARFYIGAEYIEGKEMGLYKKMCQIVGLDPAIPRQEELNSGGPHYLMKNVTAEFWHKVYDDCEAMYAYFVKHLEVHPEESEAYYSFPAYNPIQKWTADMWAVLWNGWYYKHPIKVVPQLDFCWATQELHEWNKCLIFHNAGVVFGDDTKDKFFYKGKYIDKLPYLDVKIDQFSGEASRKYVEEIISTGKVSCLLTSEERAQIS